MNKKGFTLFTALVSFVLILLTAMIVQTMIKAERDRIEVISNIEEQAEMQAMADLTRAEALQTFNYSLRKGIENYFDNSGTRRNSIIIYAQDYNFDELKDNFARRFFGAFQDSGSTSAQAGDVFARQMEEAIIGALPGIKFIGPYEISLKFKSEEDETLKREIVRNAFKKALQASVKENFFEVVNCEKGNPKNCLGTFYLNLRIGDLNDETYESFPQIKIKNPRTQRVLQESIFPKGTIKIYVPIRLFKAMAEARSLALEFEKETGSSWKENYGLFSPRIHNEIEEMKLGICDPGYCSVRTNPYTPPKTKNMNAHSCPNTSLDEVTHQPFGEVIPIKCTSDLIERKICSPGESIVMFENAPLKYNPSYEASPNSQSDTVSLLVKRRLCGLAQKNYAEGKYLDPIIDGTRDDFILAENNSGSFQCPLGTEGQIISFNINSTTRNSVKVSYEGEDDVGVQNISSPSYGANIDGSCPLTYSLTQWGIYGIGINNDNKIIQKTIKGQECSFNFSTRLSTAYATCSEVNRIEINLSFKETNQNYIINKNNKPVYVIELIDNKFTPASRNEYFHQNKQFGVDNTTCGLMESPVSNTCNQSQWKCNSYGAARGMPGTSGVSGGCEVP